MKEETEEIRSERDALNRFVKEMSEHQDRKEGDEEEDEMYAGQSIEELERQSKLATDELRAADAERVQVEEEIAALDREEAELEAEEEAFWAQHSNLLLELSAVSAQRDSLRTSISLDAAQLSRLQQTNPYNDAFSIGHSGGFATINGLRLGKLPNAHVDWKEINAAWGQTALLLDVLARKVGVQFTDYHLVPKGSFSTVKKASGDEAVYELYGTGDWQIGRLLAPQSRRFDHAMVAFLELLRQLAAAACASDPELRLPHAISKDRIGEASIRLHFGSEETWTRALRHVLLTWVIRTVVRRRE
ncbi:autophagy protein 6 [Ceraceosorus guamensis]|uniref:Autophagy protein 6 n=1 Tax=Ceraceosorus guamensis TaxID=1522189 RepID=A0A316W1X7_9BASI|nr:autophagy protein 6 [Ceraceosorus guamensis]PWN41675.1 autophagy protein 6 [Ceraceosorus guamensis]